MTFLSHHYANFHSAEMGARLAKWTKPRAWLLFVTTVQMFTTTRLFSTPDNQRSGGGLDLGPPKTVDKTLQYRKIDQSPMRSI